MLCLCILLPWLIRTVNSLGLREVHLESSVVREDSATISPEAQARSAVLTLRDRSTKLQEELSHLRSNVRNVAPGVSQANEIAFRLPDGLQSAPSGQLLFAPREYIEAVPSENSEKAPSKALSLSQQPIALQPPTHAIITGEGIRQPKNFPQASLPHPYSNKPLLRKAGNMQAAAVRSSHGNDDDDDEMVGAGHSPTGGAIDATSIRPTPNGADTISFGLYAKTFYGINLKANSFVIDVVMTLKWADQRVKSLIPAGLQEATLSKKESEDRIWLPGMAVTNRDIKKYDLISTSVVINNGGEVFKVERATAICKCKYILDDFPFDRQDLQVKIASTKYMIDEVVVQTDHARVGSRSDLFDGDAYKLVSVKASTFADVDGALKKSRGILTIRVERKMAKYIQSHLIPAALITVISWGVFWFPFVAPFITPRLALSILALLSFTGLKVKSNDALPAGAPFNWNDVINQTILTLMFATVCLNVFSEICFHQLKVDELARHVNHECKALLPIMTTISLLVIMSTAGPDAWMSLHTTSVLVKSFNAVVFVGYMCFNGQRTFGALAKNRMEKEAKALTKPFESVPSRQSVPPKEGGGDVGAPVAM